MYINSLTELYKKTPGTQITDNDKITFFSDLHMGNKGRQDDFHKNANLFSKVLRKYYLQNDFQLVLNGDVEDLHKFSLEKVVETWLDVYSLFLEFDKRTRLYKLIGNHDYALPFKHGYMFYDKIQESIKFNYNGHDIFVFHGHQASNMIDKYNTFFGFFLRYLIKPLGWPNVSTAYDSRRKYKVEKNVYQFSTRQRVVSILGHTHRPLFESLSKVDSLKFKIENLCRVYPQAPKNEKKNIESEITKYKKQLKSLSETQIGTRSSLYNSEITIPCMFNSGTVIGKRGMTALEIKNGRIYLVYWYDDRVKQKSIPVYDEGPVQLEDTHFHKIVLKHDPLDYIFARIKLLSD